MDYASLPLIEPTEVTAGDTFDWRREDLATDYPATTWTLTYKISKVDATHAITATAQGSYFRATVSAADSATWQPGDYTWQAYVTSGTERYTVGTGTLRVLPNLADDKHHDLRSHARKTLDAIEAVLERRGSLDQQQMQINGRSLTRTPLPELIRLHSHYKNMVATEDAQARIGKGLGAGYGKIQVRIG